MTHRQFLAWQEWDKLEWNRPDRHDYYQMQTTAEVRRSINPKKARRIKPNDLKIPFSFEKGKAENIATETQSPDIHPDYDHDEEAREIGGMTMAERNQITARTKAQHRARYGGRVRVIKRPASERPKLI